MTIDMRNIDNWTARLEGDQKSDNFGKLVLEFGTDEKSNLTDFRDMKVTDIVMENYDGSRPAHIHVAGFFHSLHNQVQQIKWKLTAEGLGAILAFGESGPSGQDKLDLYKGLQINKLVVHNQTIGNKEQQVVIDYFSNRVRNIATSAYGHIPGKSFTGLEQEKPKTHGELIADKVFMVLATLVENNQIPNAFSGLGMTNEQHKRGLYEALNRFYESMKDAIDTRSNKAGENAFKALCDIVNGFLAKAGEEQQKMLQGSWQNKTPEYNPEPACGITNHLRARQYVFEATMAGYNQLDIANALKIDVEDVSRKYSSEIRTAKLMLVDLGTYVPGK